MVKKYVMKSAAQVKQQQSHQPHQSQQQQQQQQPMRTPTRKKAPTTTLSPAAAAAAAAARSTSPQSVLKNPKYSGAGKSKTTAKSRRTTTTSATAVLANTTAAAASKAAAAALALEKAETIDQLVSQVDREGTDKYRAMVSEQPNLEQVLQTNISDISESSSGSAADDDDDDDGGDIDGDRKDEEDDDDDEESASQTTASQSYWTQTVGDDTEAYTEAYTEFDDDDDYDSDYDDEDSYYDEEHARRRRPQSSLRGRRRPQNSRQSNMTAAEAVLAQRTISPPAALRQQAQTARLKHREYDPRRSVVPPPGGLQGRSRGLMMGGNSKLDRLLTAEEIFLSAEESDYLHVKQKLGYGSIAISAIQLLILSLQLALCGVAPLDINPMVGPFPDAFSEWGGKNAYLLVQGMEYWRFLTPAFLHVGVLHLLLNSYVQLETSAMLEREWGTSKWIIIYVLSEIGCNVVSCVTNPDTIAVGSSGAIMGLFGAKVAHVLTITMFETQATILQAHAPSSASPSKAAAGLVSATDESIQVEQLSSLLCSLAMVFCLSFFTYIDWSGHMGGLGTGFSVGMIVLSTSVRHLGSRWVWRFLGLVLFVAGWILAFDALLFDGRWTGVNGVDLDGDLADPCEYFRNLFDEGHDCQCLRFGTFGLFGGDGDGDGGDGGDDVDGADGAYDANDANNDDLA